MAPFSKRDSGEINRIWTGPGAFSLRSLSATDSENSSLPPPSPKRAGHTLAEDAPPTQRPRADSQEPQDKADEDFWAGHQVPPLGNESSSMMPTDLAVKHAPCKPLHKMFRI